MNIITFCYSCKSLYCSQGVNSTKRSKDKIYAKINYIKFPRKNYRMSNNKINL